LARNFKEHKTAKRGRKPIDIRLLNVWEFEWYKALHLLRDGTMLRPEPVYIRMSREHTEAELTRWRAAKPKEILGDMRFDSEPGSRKPLTEREGEWAELLRDNEIANLKHQLDRLKPRQIYAQAERRKIWESLWRSHTPPALRQACESWKQLRDVRRMGFTCFADHVLANANQFLAMKLDVRFPRTQYADESRLEYLARGMAGVIIGASPITAVERLRNMKHRPGGPLWSEANKRCDCWRCETQRWRDLWHRLEKGAKQ
jgi:hypothetical protein